MNNASTHAMGGLVLQCQDLKTILEEPLTVGLAFGVAEPGDTSNVELEVYRVFKQGNEFIGESRKVEDKKGAARFNQLPSTTELFYFEYKEKLETSGFYFAYLEKEIFLNLIKDGEPEVFISGCLKDHGNTGAITGEWFSLKIEPRDDVVGEGTVFMGIPPDSYFMPPCPPFWTREYDSLVHVKGQKRISFRKK